MNFECDIISNNETMDYVTTTQTTNNSSQQQQQQQQNKQLLHSDSSVSPFNISNDDYNTHNHNTASNNTFDCLINQSRSNSNSNSLNDSDNESNDSNNDFNNLNFILNSQQQQQQQQKNDSFLPSINSFNIENFNTNTAAVQNNYLIERNVNYNQDFINSVNKIQYVLMAPTSPAVKVNEDTLTYLNQGQSYELKFNRLDFNKQSFINNSREMVIKKCEDDDFKDTNDNQIYLSIIRICFWDRKFQEVEHEEIKEVIKRERERDLFNKSFKILL
jgi:hypothetical protein